MTSTTRQTNKANSVAAVQPAATTADQSLVKFINELIAEAAQSRASDIHFEPFPPTPARPVPH